MVCKITINLRRKEGVSEEQFHEYWSKNHARTILGHPLATQKIITYTQYHLTSAELDRFKGLSELARGDKWDGVVNITVEKVEDLNELFEHPYYSDVIIPDEHEFIDRYDTLVMVGYDEPKVVDYKIL